VSVFRTRSSDDIIFVSSGTRRGEGHFENVPHTRREGIESRLAYEGTRGALFAAYTAQRAAFGSALDVASLFHPLARDSAIHVTAGRRIPGVPTHLIKAGGELRPRAWLLVGMTARAQSSQWLRGDEANLLEPLPGFAIVDAELRGRLARRVEAVARIDNLFDRRYSTFGVLGSAALIGDDEDPRFESPGAPRSAWIGFDVRF
jgi:outer membrane receptor protein involved in Fe transport